MNIYCLKVEIVWRLNSMCFIRISEKSQNQIRPISM